VSALELHSRLALRKSRGCMLGQPADIASCFVTTSEGFTARRSIAAAALIIERGGHLSDFSELAPLYGFAGVPLEGDHADA